MTTPRVRFCPSPTGTPHVGLIRTALFNWAYARHTGGALIFRLEDTDAERNSEESYRAILDALHWLGLDYDEGPDIGGPYGPYRQSERSGIYREIITQLVEAGEAYEDFSTPEEVQARHLAAGRNPKLGYDNFDRDLTEEQKAAYRAQGRTPVIRLKMPDIDLSWVDLVYGETTFPAGSIPDFVLARANGDPLYTLVNPVDDALMGITHVLRGEDLLASTPRQLALYQALMRLGITTYIPEFGHLPRVLGEGNKKLSKRDPQSNLFAHRDRGFIPEGLLNYLALLGWSLAPDQDVFEMAEMVKAFCIRDVNVNPARFDQKKADALNGEHLRRLSLGDFTHRLASYFSTYGYDTTLEPESFARAADLIQTRINVFAEGWDLLKFFNDTYYEIDPIAAQKELSSQTKDGLCAAYKALDDLLVWGAPEISQVLKDSLVTRMQLKPRKAFGPLRVAITGSMVSPPLFESMELLGRQRTLQRLKAVIDQLI